MTNTSNKRAIILAGGQGTRLKPYTTLLPKALVPLGETPVLELVLKQLKAHGFTEITLAVGHLASLIEAYFGDGSRLGIEIVAEKFKGLGIMDQHRLVHSILKPEMDTRIHALTLKTVYP